MTALLLLALTAAADANTTPAAPPPLHLEVWTEPLALVGSGLFSALSAPMIVFPLGAEIPLGETVKIHLEATLLHLRDSNNDFESIGFLGAAGVQIRLFHFGLFDFFVEPRLVGGWVKQSLIGGGPDECAPMCQINATGTELGGGVVVGASTVFWHGVYFAMTLGGQVTWFTGMDNSIVGVTFLTLTDGITAAKKSNVAVTPNVNLLRVGVAF